MADELISERELSLEEYLAVFAEGTADLDLIRARSANISNILQRTLKDEQGRTFVDTVFREKNGISYTIRARD